MRKTSVQGEASAEGIGASWIKGTAGKESSPGGGHSRCKDPVVAGSQAQLELRKVSLPAVELGKGLGMMKSCGQTLEAWVLLSQVGEGWVSGEHMESVILLAAASRPSSSLPPGTPILASSCGPALGETLFPPCFYLPGASCVPCLMAPSSSSGCVALTSLPSSPPLL